MGDGIYFFDSGKTMLGSTLGVSRMAHGGLLPAAHRTNRNIGLLREGQEIGPSSAAQPIISLARIDAGSSGGTHIVRKGQMPRSQLLQAPSLPSFPSPDAPQVCTLLTPEVLEEVLHANLPVPGTGRGVGGIPGMVQDPDLRSAAVVNQKTGEIIATAEAYSYHFSQQSTGKPVGYVMAIKVLGDQEIQRMRAIYGDDFASTLDPWRLGQKAMHLRVLGGGNGDTYKSDRTPPGRPDLVFNSSDNMGAILMAATIRQNIGEGQDPFEEYLKFERDLAGNELLEPNLEMAQGEYRATMQEWGDKRTGNFALVKTLIGNGLIKDEAEGREVLWDYCRWCSFMVNVVDTTVIGATLRTGVQPISGVRFFPTFIADAMRTNDRDGGAYTETGKIAQKTGGGSFKTGVHGSSRGGLVHQNHLTFGFHQFALNRHFNPWEAGKCAIDLSRRGKLVTPGDLEAERKEADGIGMVGMPGTHAGNVPLQVAPGSAMASMRGTVEATFKTSPLQWDRRLRAAAGEDTLLRLAAEVDVDDAAGLRLKPFDPMNGTKSLKYGHGGKILLTAIDRHGESKTYIHVPDHEGYLEKIVVAPSWVVEKLVHYETERQARRAAYEAEQQARRAAAHLSEVD